MAWDILANICLDNGLEPNRGLAITFTNAVLLLILP